MNRLAVSDAQRVLTCDPVEGGGRAYIIHETVGTTHNVIPNLLTWSVRGEMLATVQESADGCKAGAYPRPLLSSTWAVSDTRKRPTHPRHPLNTGYTPPTRTPYPIQSAQIELKSGRV